MSPAKNAEAVTDVLARQGYSLPPGRAAAVAQTAAELAATGHGLAEELPFSADLYAFFAHLARWREQ